MADVDDERLFRSEVNEVKLEHFRSVDRSGLRKILWELSSSEAFRVDGFPSDAFKYVFVSLIWLCLCQRLHMIPIYSFTGPGSTDSTFAKEQGLKHCSL